MAQIDIIYEGELSTRCIHGESGAEIFTDAPKDNKGKGRQFSPTDLIGVALGSCILTLMGIAADNLKIDIKGAKVSVAKEMQQAPVRRIAKITVYFTFPLRFDPEITARLEKAASSCPVKQSLHPDIVQEFIFEWGKS